MKKQEWFDTVKSISQSARANGVRFGRVFSDKRKNGYRTKFYHVYMNVELLIYEIGKRGIDFEEQDGSIIIKSDRKPVLKGREMKAKPISARSIKLAAQHDVDIIIGRAYRDSCSSYFSIVQLKNLISQLKSELEDYEEAEWLESFEFFV